MSTFSVALSVEFSKLRRSLSLVLVAIAPTLISVFVFFNVLRGKHGLPWQMLLVTSAGI
jgi:ABC-2 type transport system permease protein